MSAQTTRVTMLNTESGRAPGFGENGQYHCRAGHEYEVPSRLAASWVAQGIAKLVRKKLKPQSKLSTTTKGAKHGDE